MAYRIRPVQQEPRRNTVLRPAQQLEGRSAVPTLQVGRVTYRSGGRQHRSLRSLDASHPAADLLTTAPPRKNQLPASQVIWVTKRGMMTDRGRGARWSSGHSPHREIALRARRSPSGMGAVVGFLPGLPPTSAHLAAVAAGALRACASAQGRPTGTLSLSRVRFGLRGTQGSSSFLV
jgi:hypothetical protein